MLQQILKDMWVDPEILAELDDDQKQTLFCKMREEQVRRWRQWDQKLNQQEQSGVKSTSKTTTKTGKPRKNVNFMLDVDGEPWTWVMGEHENDRTIEEILLEEAKELARKQAEKEAEELRKKVEALTEYIDLTPNKIEDFDTCEKDSLEIDDSMEIYCSVDELREKINKKPLKKTMNNYTFNNYQSRNMVTFNNMNNLVNNDKRDILNELSLNTPVKVSQKVALWEKRVMEERTSEIFKKIQKKQLEAAKEAEECERVQEHLWKEQERKAKEAEQKIREIARRAREEHRRTSALENQDSEPYSEVPLSGAKPPGKQAVIEWYRVSEIPRKAGIEDRDQPAPWFHGLIDRQEAELLLSNKSEGNFLVRISERIWGYAISYKAADRCKHYLVDASSGHYQFLGANQIAHETLGDLIKYHSQHVITEVGGEKLLYPCPRNGDPAILKGVFR